MKKLISTLIATFVFVACSAVVPKDMPAVVLAAFVKKYPDVKVMEYEKERDFWEIEFEMNGYEYEALFNNEGKWLETEKDIEEKDLPDTIKAYISNNYQEVKYKEIEFKETPGGNTYETEIKTEGNRITLIFNEDGTFKSIEEDD